MSTGADDIALHKKFPDRAAISIITPPTISAVDGCDDTAALCGTCP